MYEFQVEYGFIYQIFVKGPFFLFLVHASYTRTTGVTSFQPQCLVSKDNEWTLTSISTRKSNLLRTKLCVAPLKFRNGSVISSYTLTCVLLLIHAEIKVNLSY